jgi:hypothetical protein
VAHPERASGLHLAAGHRLDSRTVDLGGVGAVGDRDRQHAEPEIVRFAEPLRQPQRIRQELERGDAAGDEEDEHQQRDAAEDVDIGDRGDADRQERLPRQLPQGGEYQPPDQGEDAAEDRELDRDPEPIQDFVEVVDHEADVEELVEELLHLSPIFVPGFP